MEAQYPERHDDLPRDEGWVLATERRMEARREHLPTRKRTFQDASVSDGEGAIELTTYSH